MIIKAIAKPEIDANIIDDHILSYFIENNKSPYLFCNNETAVSLGNRLYKCKKSGIIKYHSELHIAVDRLYEQDKKRGPGFRFPFGFIAEDSNLFIIPTMNYGEIELR